MMKRTRVKICGITNREDAAAAAAAGVDALGFIFAESTRRILPEEARTIITSLPPFITAVGVFMDQPKTYITETADAAGISLIQLHGGEPPSYCCDLPLPVIKRYAITDTTALETIRSWQSAYRNVYTLLDPGAGSGRTFDWSIPGRMTTCRLVIAGGLGPHNVADAVAAARPYAVDVCSRVEIRPGKKDHFKIKRLMEVLKQ